MTKPKNNLVVIEGIRRDCPLSAFQARHSNSSRRPVTDGLAGLDPHEVVAMRLLDGGGLSVVTSDRRRMVDCVLAMRIMLHQMQKAVPI